MALRPVYTSGKMILLVEVPDRKEIGTLLPAAPGGLRKEGAVVSTRRRIAACTTGRVLRRQHDVGGRHGGVLGHGGRPGASLVGRAGLKAVCRIPASRDGSAQPTQRSGAARQHRSGRTARSTRGAYQAMTPFCHDGCALAPATTQSATMAGSHAAALERPCAAGKGRREEKHECLARSAGGRAARVRASASRGPQARAARRLCCSQARSGRVSGRARAARWWRAARAAGRLPVRAPARRRTRPLGVAQAIAGAEARQQTYPSRALRARAGGHGVRRQQPRAPPALRCGRKAAERLRSCAACVQQDSQPRPRGPYNRVLPSPAAVLQPTLCRRA